jgi:hypothetical protein
MGYRQQTGTDGAEPVSPPQLWPPAGFAYMAVVLWIDSNWTPLRCL